ncbi:MAG: prephenate dehydrogenase [Candidatus Omnitrophica bacterium]|nr:prephenate dehydrogenase [Candidatus Omnitrophota bacterium]
MKMFNKVVIIGTGLIGGSLGLALKKQHLAGRVIGFSRQQKNARLAKRAGAIDEIGVSLDAVVDADLVVLATPIDTIIDFALKIEKKIKKSCIVIDVGSSKENIVSRLSTAIPGFIGCHPLAGSEKKGAANIKPDLFKGSLCVLTPVKQTDKHSLHKIKLLWKKMGAKVIVCTPLKHDQILAFTSHLPHAVAFSLMGAVPVEFLHISSGGLNDSTRISASDANLWSQIFLSNRKHLLPAISSFQKKLIELKLALDKKDKAVLTKILESAKKKREKLG